MILGIKPLCTLGICPRWAPPHLQSDVFIAYLSPFLKEVFHAPLPIFVSSRLIKPLLLFKAKDVSKSFLFLEGSPIPSGVPCESVRATWDSGHDASAFCICPIGLLPSSGRSVQVFLSLKVECFFFLHFHPGFFVNVYFETSLRSRVWFLKVKAKAESWLKDEESPQLPREPLDGSRGTQLLLAWLLHCVCEIFPLAWTFR